jgi:hypothetical protein
MSEEHYPRHVLPMAEGGIFKFEDLGDCNAILVTFYVEACNSED